MLKSSSRSATVSQELGGGRGLVTNFRKVLPAPSAFPHKNIFSTKLRNIFQNNENPSDWSYGGGKLYQAALGQQSAENWRLSLWAKITQSANWKLTPQCEKLQLRASIAKTIFCSLTNSVVRYQIIRGVFQWKCQPAFVHIMPFPNGANATWASITKTQSRRQT